MSYNVGDLVAEFLSAIGVTTVFGIVSVHNIPMLDGIGRRNTIRFVMGRGELGASHMADGYARITGGLGVLFSSTGPGAANAVAGLVEAGFAATPVLHITGQTGSKFIGHGMGTAHEVPDQLGMLRAVSKAAFHIHSAQAALGILTQAAVTALTAPQGPVSVEIPIDVQRTAIERPPGLDSLQLLVPVPLPPSAAALDALAEHVRKSSRPILWMGAGAREAGPAARQLLDLGFGMVTSWAGRGSVPEDHPRTLGGLNGNGVPAVQEFYRNADLMLVAGSRLRGHETAEFHVKLPENLVHIDIDPAAEGRTYPCRMFVNGDATLVLEGLAKRLSGWSPASGYGDEFAAMKQRARADFAATLGPYETFPAQLRAALPRDVVWSRDITINNSTWGNRLFELYGPRDSVYPIGAGIGVGLGLGIGAAIGAAERKPGRRTVSMTGDGGFFLTLTELWTAVQDKVDITIVVMNDRGYGVIKHIQNSLYGGRNFYADLMGPELEPLAALAGIPYFRIDRADAFGDTVAQASAAGGPSLVEVDMTAIGTFPPYAPYDRKRS